MVEMVHRQVHANAFVCTRARTRQTGQEKQRTQRMLLKASRANERMPTEAMRLQTWEYITSSFELS